jgi:hypothetical protein
VFQSDKEKAGAFFAVVTVMRNFNEFHNLPVAPRNESELIHFAGANQCRLVTRNERESRTEITVGRKVFINENFPGLLNTKYQTVGSVLERPFICLVS